MSRDPVYPSKSSERHLSNPRKPDSKQATKPFTAPMTKAADFSTAIGSFFPGRKGAYTPFSGVVTMTRPTCNPDSDDEVVEAITEEAGARKAPALVAFA
jgi:hypothetical protein